MKRLIQIVVLTFLANLSFGQTLEDIFNVLPLEYTPELTDAGKDSLLQFGKYIIPGGDSIATMKCVYSSDTDDHIMLDYGFTTGQSGFIVIELRKFRKTNGQIVVVYSKYGGLLRAFDQHTLLTFDYQQNSLKKNKDLGLPETIKANEFLKEDLPDSLDTKKITLSTSYNLNSEETNSIEYLIYPQIDKFNNWIRIDRFLFTWNGEIFEKGKE